MLMFEGICKLFSSNGKNIAVNNNNVKGNTVFSANSKGCSLKALELASSDHKISSFSLNSSLIFSTFIPLFVKILLSKIVYYIEYK
ncbi:MAG: hypothetical protein EAX96_14695 [Candidatus Lokiarchaeota archaeon]|nr:hypothetical protein [Candidatus Lokiarchaeota archaeon]